MSNDTTAIAAYDPTLAALGMEQGEALKPSNLRLTQPIETADEEGLIAGRFLDAQSNMQFPSLNMIVLQIAPGRVCYPPGSDRGAKPLCRSRDGLLPVIQDGLIRQDNGKGCAKCPMSQWKKIGGKSIKPPCRETINFLLADLETEFVYRYNVKGTSLAPVKELRQTILKSVQYAKVKGVTIPYYGLVFEMSSVKLKNNQGTYFNPKFVPAGTLLDQNKYADGLEKMERFAQMAEYFMKRGKDFASDEEETTDAVDAALQGEYAGTVETQEYQAA